MQFALVDEYVLAPVVGSGADPAFYKSPGGSGRHLSTEGGGYQRGRGVKTGDPRKPKAVFKKKDKTQDLKTLRDFLIFLHM